MADRVYVLRLEVEVTVPEGEAEQTILDNNEWEAFCGDHQGYVLGVTSEGWT